METSSDIGWTRALAGLDDNEVRRIERCLGVREVPARTPIFHQGDPAGELFIVRSGRVRLIRRMESGEEFTSGVWSEGYLIGLISAFLGEPRFLAAESLEQTSLRVLRSTELHACMQAVPRFALNIAHLLALLASDSIRRAAPLALESVEAKLGRVLVKLAEADPSGTTHVVRGITQDELGSMVGASRPWVNRALAAFERRGLLRRDKQQILLLDIAACRRLWTD